MIWVAQLNCGLEILTTWDEWHHGETGDWRVSQKNICIVKKIIF